METTKKLIGVGMGIAIVAGTSLAVRHAMAEGIPSVDTLSYSGYLEEANVAVDGPRDVVVRLYANVDDTSSACAATAPGTMVTNGHFRVALPAGCTALVNDDPSTYVEIEVMGEPLGRVALGAVPYAIEADHAVTASDAARAERATSAATADRSTTAALADRASRLELSSGATSARLGVYIGSTGTSSSANLGGYAGARATCDRNYPGSHLCTQTEMQLSTQLGIYVWDGPNWIAGGGNSVDSNGSSRWLFGDCQGFTSGAPGTYGSVWRSSGPSSGIDVAECNFSAAPLACCN